MAAVIGRPVRKIKKLFLLSQASPQHLKCFSVAVYELIWSQFQDQGITNFLSSGRQAHSACNCLL